MAPPENINIGAVLAAAYRRPDVGLDQVAAKVRARMALAETMGECLRLLIEVPGAALSASLPKSPIWDDENTEVQDAEKNLE